jgi:hypothetical protein
MKAIDRRLRRLNAHFVPAGPGRILTEVVSLNAQRYGRLSEEEREEWLEKQRALKSPGTPDKGSPWANWNKMHEDSSIQ